MAAAAVAAAAVPNTLKSEGHISKIQNRSYQQISTW
jgi:hypothetical protein